MLPYSELKAQYLSQLKAQGLATNRLLTFEEL